MAEPFLFEPGDIAPQENAAKVSAAREALVFEDVVDPMAFDAGYRLLDAQFGPAGEMERREVLEGWFMKGSLSSPTAALQARYHMLVARDRTGAIVGVRDCFTALDPRIPRVVVLLSHSLVLPAWRRSGVAALLRAAPAVYARRDAQAAGFARAETTLVAEMEPVDPRELDTVVRLLAYSRSGFRVVPPALVPYAQPDFRDLDALRVDAAPIPMMLVVRQVGDETLGNMQNERVRATLEGLRAIHAPVISAQQLEMTRDNVTRRMPTDGAPLQLLAPRSALDLSPLLRSRLLPLYPESWRGKPAADPVDEQRLLQASAEKLDAKAA